MSKNILIFGAASEIAQALISLLLENGENIFAVSRSAFAIENSRLKKFRLDLSDDSAIAAFFKNIEGIKFNAAANFHGVAISSPVEFLKRENLQKQFDISIFSLAAILNNLRGRIAGGGKVINISSMASYGLFPFLAPYSMAKAAADIMLFCYETETGIKTVSIKPGVVGTKFWKFCINENDFANFPDEYEITGKFLKESALKNSAKGLKPVKVAELVQKVIYAKNPKASYIIGLDARIAAFAANFKGHTLSRMIKKS